MIPLTLHSPVAPAVTTAPAESAKRTHIHTHTPVEHAAAEKIHAHLIGNSYRNGLAQQNFRMNPLRRRQPPSISIEDDLKNCFDSDAAGKDPMAMRMQLLETAHPLFYLSAARKNKLIRDALIKLDVTPACADEAKKIAMQIRQGNWEIVSHHHFAQFPASDARHGTHIKDSLLYSFWRGDLSRAEFQTAINHLNIAEQVVGSIAPEYGYKGGKTTLLQTPGKVKLCRVFDAPGSDELTPEAEYYFQQIQHVFDHARANRMPKKFDRDFFIRELKKIPENLQVFSAITDIKGADLATEPELAYWAGELLYDKDTPILGADISGAPIADAHVYGDSRYAFRSNMENPQIQENHAFHCPSYGMLQAFLLTQTRVGDNMAHMAVNQPIMCLNAVSSETEAAMHSNMAHPVWVGDERTRANLTHPHNMLAAAVFAEMGHDAAIHSHLLTRTKPSTKVLACATLPGFMEAEAESDLEKKIARQFNEKIGDLVLLETPGEPLLELILLDFLTKLSAEQMLAEQNEGEITTPKILALNQAIFEFGNKFLHALESAQRDAERAAQAPGKFLDPRRHNPFRSPYGSKENGENYFSVGFKHLNAVFSNEKLDEYKQILASMPG